LGWNLSWELADVFGDDPSDFDATLGFCPSDGFEDCYIAVQIDYEVAGTRLCEKVMGRMVGREIGRNFMSKHLEALKESGYK
jgi:hypothetical protein